MQIIIPMTGYGSRFVAAGYSDLKPMIKIIGRPMIEWIIKKMYSQEDEFILICREEHFINGQLDEQYLKSLSRCVNIVKLREWEKLGPVVDVLKSSDRIDDKSPCIVNYCDFYAPWNWKKAREAMIERGCEGAIVSFTGFHPCLIPKSNIYASSLCDDDDNLIEIKEKYRFVENRFEGRYSTGTYYFRSGKTMKECFQTAVDRLMTTKNEYYCSLPFNVLVEEGYKVWVPIFDKFFFTWGTPEDVEFFKFWFDNVKGWSA